jgi:hypothetical protein
MQTTKAKVQSPKFTNQAQWLAFDHLDTVYAGITLEEINLKKIMLYRTALRSISSPDRDMILDEVIQLTDFVEEMCELMDGVYGLYHDETDC